MLVFSGLLIFGSFLFSLWILFSSKSYTQSNQVWLKPISAIIMSFAIIEGHFLLRRASFTTPKVLGGSSADSPFIIYLETVAKLERTLWHSSVNARLKSSINVLMC